MQDTRKRRDGTARSYSLRQVAQVSTRNPLARPNNYYSAVHTDVSRQGGQLYPGRQGSGYQRNNNSVHNDSVMADVQFDSALPVFGPHAYYENLPCGGAGSLVTVHTGNVAHESDSFDDYE